MTDLGFYQGHDHDLSIINELLAKLGLPSPETLLAADKLEVKAAEKVKNKV